MANKKILVVDDEKDMAKALKVRLKANGYNVVFASDSVEAFTVANQENPDLILLDIMIPGGGGFVVAERLKQSAATHRIPIIFLTGIQGGQERAYKLGASGYLMKPYQPEELMETIHNALETSRRRSAETAGGTTGAVS
ncbi:MAG TPA: response regulator [Thermodesulfobacteriota bacterium]|nr:response regulator [Thermodesulfobacteriota bacterium]